jgi:excisionase family DNA binding protein
MDPLFTTHDVANLLQVDASTISKWIDKNILVAFRTPGGHRRVRQGDLVAFLKQHNMPVPRELSGVAFQLLVIDDEKPVLDAIKRLLRPFTHVEVHTSTSGIEGVLLASELKPDGILVDLNMPELDGFEFFRAVRNRPALKDVKLITMTAQHTKALYDASLKAGAISCLAKPIDVADLQSILRFAPLAERKSA